MLRLWDRASSPRRRPRRTSRRAVREERRCALRRAENQRLCASCAVRPAGDAHKGDARGRRYARTLNGMRNDVRCGDLIKVLWHDGQGFCLFSKRLERGRFLWPSPADGAVTITPAQLGYLLEGIDWRMPQKTWRPLAAG